MTFLRTTRKVVLWSLGSTHSVLLFFQSPNAEDGGDYKCIVKNELGQLQAKLNLNIEAEPATPSPDQAAAGAPTFTEKPKIVTLEEGRLVQVGAHYVLYLSIK